MGKPRRDPLERFNEKWVVGEMPAEWTGVESPTSPCWVWVAGDNGLGYGRFWSGSKLVYAHRWSYEHHVGPIPAGLEPDHLCRNPPCVNPEHLEPVTRQVNTLRGRAPTLLVRTTRRLAAEGRHPSQLKTHCPHGHEYTQENTYDDGGRRRCRECLKAQRRPRMRAWRERNREHVKEYNAAYYAANRERILADKKAVAGAEREAA